MTDYIAFYGTLMERARASQAPSRAGLTRFLQPCRLAGVLRDHGAYPGFYPADADRTGTGPTVEAELHEILLADAFAVFDRWEEYDAADEASSLYIRRKMRLIEPDLQAWVYISQVSEDDPVVPGGDWAVYEGRI
ncbi:gamma-glutamylcyclotransferase [Fulvimarina endophytica]|uniref:Gamma-glutamylcyclotransferase n=1 Tax=Fulvimarina endophytica TaxID=2293836 RepID=A0A371X7D1_9HYPH|nr:gamma-glutamylcyclotransferase family protein [Fulvimarina endophytica]RFC65142.1 gamma-glutamylcyclotransferase [Fulvimarina endophytica]